MSNSQVHDLINQLRASLDADLAHGVESHRAGLQDRDHTTRTASLTAAWRTLGGTLAQGEAALRAELGHLHEEHGRLTGLAEAIQRDAGERLRDAIVSDFYAALSAPVRGFRAQPDRAITRVIGGHLQAFEARARGELGADPPHGLIAFCFADTIIEEYPDAAGVLCEVISPSYACSQAFGQALQAVWRTHGDPSQLEQALKNLESALVDVARNPLSGDAAARKRELARYKIVRLCSPRALKEFDARPPEPAPTVQADPAVPEQEPRTWMKGLASTIFGGV